MAWIYRCPSCGELVEGMTLPREWPPDLVRKWRMLEARMPCVDRCDGVPQPDIDD